MQQHRLVDQQFGQVAQAYLTSAVHAQGDDLDALAADHGLRRTARHAMPANNLALVYRRG